MVVFRDKVGKGLPKQFPYQKAGSWSFGIGHLVLSCTAKTREARNDLNEYKGGSWSVIYDQVSC